MFNKANYLNDIKLDKKQEFETWFSTFRANISDYNYYVDFEKCYQNVAKIKKKLNIINLLIKGKNIENDFEKFLIEYPDILKCIPILLAKREYDISCSNKTGTIDFTFKSAKQTIEQYKYFMRETGLFDLLKNHNIKNISDYVLGVEVGLNSNGRKNRGGHLMEDIVESYLISAGFIKGESYFKEMTLSKLEGLTGLDFSSLSNSGAVTKRFDFVVLTKNKTFAIECNFYNSSGSKLNETARSYKTLALESKDIEGFEFVWITDGKGWNDAKHNLKETYDVMDYIFNLNDLANHSLETRLKS